MSPHRAKWLTGRWPAHKSRARVVCLEDIKDGVCLAGAAGSTWYIVVVVVVVVVVVAQMFVYAKRLHGFANYLCTPFCCC